MPIISQSTKIQRGRLLPQFSTKLQLLHFCFFIICYLKIPKFSSLESFLVCLNFLCCFGFCLFETCILVFFQPPPQPPLLIRKNNHQNQYKLLRVAVFDITSCQSEFFYLILFQFYILFHQFIHTMYIIQHHYCICATCTCKMKYNIRIQSETETPYGFCFEVRCSNLY